MKNDSGFTLIETIIYLALFSIVIGGGMVAVFQVIQSASASNNHIIVQEEGNFLLRKIDWALTVATVISQPLSNATGTSLEINSGANKLTFTLNSTSSSLTLKRGIVIGVDGIPLNSSGVAVSDLSFYRGPSGKPDSITASFKLTSIHAGKPAMQNFSITKYLR